ncbi:MAG: hypothetical protein NTZ87_02935 [Candidatus Nomurabacteria bacterium]|nr:hypothetical protein [Candidatus Nomurabacteria bacterium]
MIADNLVQMDISNVKKGAETLAEKRKFFLESILPTLVEGQDYFIADSGRKVLSKGGAERLAEIYSITALFIADKESLAFFSNASDTVAYCCILKRNGSIVGEGRGSASLKDHDDSVNSTIKVAQKSAFVDGILRVTGMSFLFSQDFLSEDSKEEPDLEGRDSVASFNHDDLPKLMTEKQEALLRTLVAEKIHNSASREEYLKQINPNLSRFQCSELISSLLPMK